jgi:hypothetical protein
MMWHTIVIERFQNNAGEIGTFTAVGQPLAFSAISDFAVCMLTIQTATGTKFQLGIFVLVVFRRHVFDMFPAFLVKCNLETAGAAV